MVVTVRCGLDGKALANQKDLRGDGFERSTTRPKTWVCPPKVLKNPNKILQGTKEEEIQAVNESIGALNTGHSYG